jgi:ankyrin repeat protein
MLVAAVKAERQDVVQLCISEKKADPNAASEDGNSALMWAAW